MPNYTIGCHYFQQLKITPVCATIFTVIKMKKKKKYRKPSLVPLRIKLSLPLSIIACIMVFLNWYYYSPIPKDVCETTVATYSHCKMIQGRRIENKGLNLYFTDESSYYIYLGYLGNGLKESVEAIKSGTPLTVTYDSIDGEIVELADEDKVILSYSEYTEKVEQDRKFSFGFFIFTLILPIVSLARIYKEKRKYD